MTTTTTLRPAATTARPVAGATTRPVPTIRRDTATRRVTTTRRDTTTRRSSAAHRVAGPARSAGLALVGGLALTLPAVGLLDAVSRGGSTLDVAASLLVVAGLDVVVGRGLYLVAGDRALPAGYAALLSRLGHGLLLTVAAALLVLRGAEGAEAFRGDWSTASLVLAAHLLVAGVALWRSRTAPRSAALVVASAGLASLVVAALPTAGAGLLPVLVPVLLGDVVLAGALLRHGLGRS